MLEIIDLHTYYGASHVLQGVSLRMTRGMVAAVLGRNGMGKTTLCRSLVGFTPARSGRIVFDGGDITHLPPHKICARQISLVPQGRRIFPSLTVHEHLAIARRTAAGPRPRDRQISPGQWRPSAADAVPPEPRRPWDVERVFEVFPRLKERRNNRGNELSGGEQQMLAIGRALMANPLLLIMDEPTEGLAPALVAEVAALIRQLKRDGISVLLVEQNAAFAVLAADYVHVMSKGTIVHASEPMALWDNQEIKTQFLGVPAQAALRERPAPSASPFPR